MDSLPDDVLLTGILPLVNVKELQNVCHSNKRAELLCTNETLWMIRATKKYGAFVNHKPPKMSWFDFYFLKGLQQLDMPISCDYRTMSKFVKSLDGYMAFGSPTAYFIINDKLIVTEQNNGYDDGQVLALFYNKMLHAPMHELHYFSRDAFSIMAGDDPTTDFRVIYSDDMTEIYGRKHEKVWHTFIETVKDKLDYYTRQ